MRPHLTATLLTAITLMAWMPVSAAGQTRPDAALLVKVVDYFGETYTAKPNDVSAYVFFPGDVISLRIEVANRGSEAITLMTRAAGPAQSLSFDAPPEVRVSIGSSVRLHRLGGEVASAWSGQMLLDRNEALVFDAQLLVDSPITKDYVVNFHTDLRDTAGRPVAPQAPRVQFEVRASEGAAAEQACRQASRAIMLGDDAAARQWIAALLKANPQSFAAHVLGARLAERNNDVSGATQSYERALSILDSDLDTEYLRWVTDRRAIQNRANDLRALIRKRPR
jgi:hypothetical protein